MKKLMLLASALLLVCAGAFAQDRDAHKGKHDHMERTRAEKVGYITEKLALTPDEAQAFWPVYNAYDNETMEAGKAVRQARKALRPGKDQDEPSEKELKVRIEEYLKALKVQAEVLAKYNAQFLKVLPPAKVAKLYLAEETFSNKMLNEMFKRQAEHHGKPGMKEGPRGPRGPKKQKDANPDTPTVE